MKYLFKAQYSDGTEYEQTESDASKKFPNKSCFTDVLDDIKNGKELVEFTLKDKDNNSYSVNLSNCSFNLNGINVSPVELPSVLENKRLIYFRRNFLTFDPTNMQKVHNHKIAFFIGWQGNDENGKNVQQTVELP